METEEAFQEIHDLASKRSQTHQYTSLPKYFNCGVWFLGSNLTS
jgi:hypothetical protein